MGRLHPLGDVVLCSIVRSKIKDQPCTFLAKARPAKSEKKINGPKVGFNLGCCAIASYIQNQLDETRRWARFGQLWKITSKIAGLE